MSESKKADYATQSPKENYDFDSVDEMLDNVHQFIEGVYRDLSITRTETPSPNATGNSFVFSTPKRLSEPLNESSLILSSITAPVGAIGGALSPSSSNEHSHGSRANGSISSIRSPTRRNMDAEIERINRICEHVTESLRSNGVYVSKSSDNKNTAREENRSDSDISHVMSLPVSSTSIPTSTPNSSPIPRRRDIFDCVNESTAIPTVNSSQIIDLCESQTLTPEVLRQPFHLEDVHEDDDDVILVSSNVTPVIDLCTPGHMGPPIRRSLEYGQLNRRRLAEPVKDIIPFKMPSTVNRTLQCKNNNSPGKEPPGPTPFMCAVCMESCLQRQPTSTKCGHVFCNECITQAVRLTRKCPLCNTKINNNSLFRIYL